MPNQHLIKRLAGIQTMLMAMHKSGVSMSSNSKGAEREAFINSFLKKSLPPTFRIGSGDATDVSGNRSGQLDVVVEFPLDPSLPTIGTETRLYTAESIAAVIEIKSDISKQLEQVQRTAKNLAKLKRDLAGSGLIMTQGLKLQPTIPLFVVSYTGWKTRDILEDHLDSNPNIAGILIIDSGLFASSKVYGYVRGYNGPESLWAFVTILCYIANSLKSKHITSMNYI